MFRRVAVLLPLVLLLLPLLLAELGGANGIVQPRHQEQQVRRTMLAVLPSNATANNDTVTMTWPSAAFASWCATTPACDALPSANFTLNTYQFNTTAWGWQALALALAATPALASDVTVTAVRGVSDVAEVGLLPTSGLKSDTAICSSSAPCEAQLAFRLKWSVVPSDTLLCIRLVPSSVAVGGYTIAGYPAGTGGVRQVGAAVGGVVTCATTELGINAVMQYTRIVFSPPPSPPAPPPPPPLAKETGKAELPEGPVTLVFSMTFNLDFTQLAASSAVVEDFTQDTRRYISQGLAAAQPGIFANASNTLPYYGRLALSSLSPGSVVAVYRATLPDGVTDEQVEKAEQLVNSNAATLLAGSKYLPVLISGKVLYVDGQPKSSMPLWLTLVIVACSVLAALALGLGVAAYIRNRIKSSVLPSSADQAATATAAEQKQKKKKRRNKTEQDESAVPSAKVIPHTTLVPPNTAAPPSAPPPAEASKQGGSDQVHPTMSGYPQMHWPEGDGTPAGGGWFIMVPVPGPGMMPGPPPPPTIYYPAPPGAAGGPPPAMPPAPR